MSASMLAVFWVGMVSGILGLAMVLLSLLARIFPPRT